MSKVKSFVIGKDKLNAAMASAVGQDEVLSLLTAPIMERFMTTTQAGIPLDDSVIMPMFMAMPTDIKRKVADILMGQVYIDGTSIPVDINSFSARMVEYNMLLAKLLQWNLADFFTWLASVRKEGDQPTESKVA